ncbi:hypothetical protein OOZ51_11225 [Arthrobacter sp. MI7-26]|uniref:hypothetical protein n=1 Tax=Arthrobacter sp. MI7-26 TaxID=2993653 RepID=UPI002249201A|nr:hypothetical protein [Arthrobacter sp. MI7-26]MCX2748385.1 hypothetical protein [Arthrobacter sp. MI7-26]
MSLVGKFALAVQFFMNESKLRRRQLADLLRIMVSLWWHCMNLLGDQAKPGWVSAFGGGLRGGSVHRGVLKAIVH